MNIVGLLLSSILPTLIISEKGIVGERRYLDGSRCKRDDQCKSNDCRGSKCGGRNNDSWCIDDNWCRSKICLEHKCVTKARNKLNLLRTGKENVKTFVFHLEWSGIGSNFIHMLAYKSHYEKIGYKFVAYDLDYYYKYQNEGILTAFFDTKILHVLNENELKSLGNEYESLEGGWVGKREEVRPSHPTRGIPFYEWLSKETCKSLQFSEVGMARIEKFIGEKPFSDNTVSVGFHVRRGDKLTLHESTLHEAHEYVEKALIAVNGSRIDTCFVASDEFEAGEELKRALIDKKVGCKFYTLDDPSEHGNKEGVSKDGVETLRWFAELSILSQVTYFFGTFDSNAGVLVSLLRSCYTKDESNFYQSYSVSVAEPYWR